MTDTKAALLKIPAIVLRDPLHLGDVLIHTLHLVVARRWRALDWNVARFLFSNAQACSLSIEHAWNVIVRACNFALLFQCLCCLRWGLIVQGCLFGSCLNELRLCNLSERVLT